MREAISRYAGAVLEGRQDDFAAVTSILRKEKPRLEGKVIYQEPPIN